MKTTALTLIAILAVACMTTARADDKELAQAIDGAAQDLADNEWRKAEHELRKGHTDLQATQDDALRAKYGFYSAVARHQCADDAKVSKQERVSARAAAIAGYEDYLKSHPDSSGALNNLAQLYAQDPETQARALRLYDRAVDLHDARASVYALNRARLQSEMGQGSAALQSSIEAWKKDPNNSAAQELSLSLLEAAGKTEDIAQYVRELNDTGLVNRAIDTAIREINRLPEKREPLLIALADSLASPTLTQLPEVFAASDNAKVLGKHAQAADIGGGVRELLQLYQKPENPRDFSWWHRGFNYGGAPHGWFPGTTFVDLARALGDRCRLAGAEHYPCAEKYYRFALEFASPAAEPNAFLALAQIYGSTGRLDELAAIEKRYEMELFSGKGQAISRQDKRKEYEYHLALGTMYAYLGKWTDPRWDPASAIFQLENARRSVADFNREHPNGEQLQFPTQSAKLLSDGYLKTGNVDRAARLRVSEAEQALDAGDKAGARALMEGEWRASLPKALDKELVDRMRVVDQRAGQKL